MLQEALSINPATGEVLGRYPTMAADQLEAALASASASFAVWSQSTRDVRAAALTRLGDRLRARRKELSVRIAIEMGKPITDAGAEVDKCATLCEWYARNLEDLLKDEQPDVEGDGQALISFLPMGIVLGVMPWNFPLWQVLRAAVPIMAAGNGFVLKHADNVQGCAAALLACFEEAQFPSGIFTVINIDHSSLGSLLSDPRIVGVSVTAGAQAGAALASEAGRHLKKSVLELGGSDPFIVLADADLHRAAATAARARFQNCGQVCIAAKRIIVDAQVADAFLDRFVAALKQLVVGDPMDPKTQMGPMARDRLRAELHAQVQQSVSQGARVLLGGEIPDGKGFYYPPTILLDVTNDMPICREEVFGPVAPILIARDTEHALELANDSQFGLSAALWTEDVGRASELAKRLETGAVFINGMSASDPRVPIGGVKKSGYGRELSHFGLREFCNVQLRWSRR